MLLLYHANTLQSMTNAALSHQFQQNPISIGTNATAINSTVEDATVAPQGPVYPQGIPQSVPPRVIYEAYELERMRLLEEIDFNPIRAA